MIQMWHHYCPSRSRKQIPLGLYLTAASTEASPPMKHLIVKLKPKQHCTFNTKPAKLSSWGSSDGFPVSRYTVAKQKLIRGLGHCTCCIPWMFCFGQAASIPIRFKNDDVVTWGFQQIYEPVVFTSVHQTKWAMLKHAGKSNIFKTIGSSKFPQSNIDHRLQITILPIKPSSLVHT